jgi:hypothetical protein
MKTYKEHYLECKELYGDNEASIYDLTIVKNSLDFDIFNFNDLRKKISERLEDGLDCIEDEWSIKLNKWNDIPELETFCAQVMPQIEEKVFGCHLKVEHIHPYKNKINASQESSWAWHYDDCPKEYIKMAIYLNDVNESNGCMQVMLGPEGTIPVVDTYRLDPTAIKGFPPPVFPKTRIPNDVVESILGNDGRIYNLVGKMATHFIFTPNVMHKGTIPTDNAKAREAIFFFLRPSMKKAQNYISDAKPFAPEQNVKKYELD